ncbi:phosphocarrier HPr protein [gamma proteobacterium HTCC5015]|nr:phosphocarrier HPr protein [gamma proteobacterium HTCC5015]
MIERDIDVINKLGLHARAAAKLVSTASRFNAKIELAKEHRRINAKSIMGVMMLAASQGTTLKLFIEGDDEVEAEREIEALFQDYFGEGE